MITYEKSCWPNEENPVELYLYVKRNEDNAGRIVILDHYVNYTNLNMIAKTPEEVEEWLEVLRVAWKMKVMQDTKGWGKK